MGGQRPFVLLQQCCYLAMTWPGTLFCALCVLHLLTSRRMQECCLMLHFLHALLLHLLHDGWWWARVVGVHFSTFLPALNFAVIHTVLRDVGVDMNRNLISYYASLYVSSGEPTLATDVCQSASRMHRNYGDAVAHHSTHSTQHHTRTYQHQQLAHKQSNAPQKPIRHQPQHGVGRRRRFAWRPSPGC